MAGYIRLSVDLHGHGLRLHEHAHDGPHAHDRSPCKRRGHREHTHGHSHGLVDDGIKRSREGLRAVGLSLGILGLAALAQTAIFLATGSVALLADLIHNFGDAATAIPLGIAFLLRSRRAEQFAGLFVVSSIFCRRALPAPRRSHV